MVKRNGRAAAAGLAALCLLALLVLPVFCYSYVYDDAGIFSADEATSLDSLAAQYSSSTGANFFVLTSSDTSGSSESYADSYYDSLASGTSGMLYFIDMANSVGVISTSGDMINYLTDDRISSLYDAAGSYLSTGDYAGAAKAVLDGAMSYIEAGIPAGQQTSGGGAANSLSGLDILVAVGAGLIAALVVAFSVKGSYELAGSTYTYDYQKMSKVSLTRRADTFIRTETVVRRREQPSEQNDGNVSTTHTSDSGNTHGGGGGRKF